ncbi:MAG: hypothetical protein DRH93_08340 [Deltaproteobacteria bacterium]|nr:MAG: hypothetical protein DRH93_08340 [Deltaproteobacteria bacterium]
MPISKNRRAKKTMKPRTFNTKKSARRYISRFKWQFFAERKYEKRILKTMGRAYKTLLEM